MISSLRFDDLADDPAVLPDHAVPREAELLVGRQCAVEEEARRYRPGGFRVSLDDPTAELRDQVERAGESCSRHASTPVTLADKVARDPPIRPGRLTLLIGRSALDPRHLVG